MSSKVTVKLNRENIKKLLNSENIKQFDEEIASQVVGRAGEGYAFGSHFTGQRIITNIYPATAEASHDNYVNNTLIRSLR